MAANPRRTPLGAAGPLPSPALTALRRAYQATRNALEAELHGSGLTSTQLEVLKLLLRPELKSTLQADGLDQRDIQAALGITSATLTRLLAGMERRGLVQRRPNPEDSRGKRVSTTAKARKVFSTLMTKREAAFNARLLAGFSERDARTLCLLLERMADNMRSSNHRPE